MIDFVYGITGGTENQLFKLIQNMDKNRFDLHLVSLRHTDWIRDNKAILKCRTRMFNIERIMSPLVLIESFRIFRHLRLVKPDIVLTFFPLANIAGVIIAKLAGIPRIVSSRRDFGLWLSWLSIVPIMFANLFVDGIIVNSKQVGQLVAERERFKKSRIHLINNGIDLPNEKKLNISVNPEISSIFSEDHRHVVGIVANLRPMKRHETFLKAAQIVLERRKDFFFVLVGDGPLRIDLEKMAFDLGISGKVVFLGTREDIPGVIRCFEIGVNCSQNEGLSNAIMEYMAHGIPCIVSEAGGNKELIQDGENGLLFQLGDHEKLAELILTLSDDRVLQERFIKESKQKIGRFAVSKMVKNYEDFIIQTLKHNLANQNNHALPKV
jgi:glycosyltransferase involved in cell wall biosynthesis